MAHKLAGTICNDSDGLHIEFNANGNATELINGIIAAAPPLSCITSYDLHEVATKQFEQFTILESNYSPDTNLPLTPDFAMCEHCKAEMGDPLNRRYDYPFITCTQCGPRFSIVQSLPYDRCNTSMHSFDMCDECKAEYEAVSDRRFFSQTNSCKKCGVQLTVFDTAKNELTCNNDEAIDIVDTCLREAKIVAIKGIGGFLLVCDATNEKAVTTLRSRKHRPAKPFALLCKDIGQVKAIAECNDKEEQELKSVAAPIVLLKQKQEAKNKIVVELIAPKINTIGVMLPYAPLLQIIANNFNKPLVATSANISSSPIIYTNEDALNNLCSIADIVVTHNREITTPQDDSVVQFTGSNKKIILRRARGMAPSYFLASATSCETAVATGALMKSSFTLLHRQNTYISQYLGSTESYDAQQTYKKTLEYFLNITGAKPEIIITDLHKGYYASAIGNELANEWNAKVYQVQHHKAHFAAVLAENNLLNHNEPVLGIIWDGTGLGDDGNIWGGEFFKYSNNNMQRCYYFDYFPVLLQDKMAKEPRLSALAACNDIANAENILQEKFTADEWNLYNTMLQQSGNIQTSSAGRIFDAVASLLNLSNKQTYEGEAALYLQHVATAYFEKHGFNFSESYFTTGAHYYRIPTKTLFTGISRDITKGKTKEYIAAKFHYSLIHIIGIVAKHIGVKNICVSGGVFQNALLVMLLKYHLNKEYNLYLHKQLSPNDENISYGQLMYYENKIMNDESLIMNEKQYQG